MNQRYDFDFIIIGSGFGGSVSACRLTEKGYSVSVMEMGKRWSANDFPSTNWNLRRWIWRPGLKLFGFYNMRLFRHVMVVSGNAVGGGSITYANTLLRAPDSVWDDNQWARLQDWKRVMPQHYASAEMMLGVTENKILGEADHQLKKMADAQGIGHSFYRQQVATFFPPEGEVGGKTYPDPYFGGEGPERGTCTGCGGCSMGCKFNAKNTLDKNYLYFAEKRGAQVFAETRVVDVRPLNGKDDGADGYEMKVESSTTWFGRQKRTVRCRHVVFAASAIGTMELLFKLKQQGSLPNISDDLGKRVRTNAESIVGVRFPKGVDLSKGVTIGSGVYADQHTHIEACRFPAGSDALGLMVSLMCSGRSGWTRIFRWLWALLLHPVAAMRVHNPFGFARESLILLVMQTIDGHINFRRKRNWYWPFSANLSSEGAPIPAYVPQGSAFAERGAKAVGGTAFTLLPEVLLNIPTTAHCMGGCAIADAPERGVIDVQNRVFGYQNMWVCDGSMLGANLGVNPSLTIAALTEHAMSYIPHKTSLNSQHDKKETR